jgi:hypothetical protein
MLRGAAPQRPRASLSPKAGPRAPAHQLQTRASLPLSPGNEFPPIVRVVMVLQKPTFMEMMVFTVHFFFLLHAECEAKALNKLPTLPTLE